MPHRPHRPRRRGPQPRPIASAITAVLTGAVMLAVAACGGTHDADAPVSTAKPTSGSISASTAKPTSGSDSASATQLPGGGTEFFPGRRIVALYGHPGAPGLGALGEQGPQASIDRVHKLAEQYRPLSDVPVVPALEIIATVAQAAPGADGTYSRVTAPDTLRPWVDAARAAGVYVILDLQPGRADPVDQAKRYEGLLAESNVGLALDPEWNLQPGEMPLQRVGHMDAGEINAVSAWLDGVPDDDAPQKLLVVHQFQAQMVRNEPALVVDRPRVRLLVQMDGQGAPGVKEGTWAAIRDASPDGMPLGWKNFLHQDPAMYGPQQTMDHDPQPLMISYQ